MTVLATNIGAAALARELGVSQPAISVRMAKGQTVEYIRAAIRQQKERGFIGKMQETRKRRTGAMGKAQAPAESQTRSYTPSRRVGIPTFTPASPVPQTKKNGNGNGHSRLSEEDVEREYEQRREKLTDAELRLAIAQADEREAKAAILHGAYVPVSQVNFHIGSAHVKFKDRLFRIPGELRDVLALEDEPVKCEKLVMDAIIAAVRELRVMVGVGELPTESGGDRDSGIKESEE